ncbi:hypothetical protein [Arthrobacter globiformis]|uniref:Uncharacterized protein n=1 Tax=Arthrobacter globiformis TaxID=1665 RepID=A0A328HBZ5_ARTGO|nr:hypothetical protein [Arthrobacter globiformis]RAM36107.1 hypothetical protein DBZ45_18385 [Arthrobacter globiformis]
MTSDGGAERKDRTGRKDEQAAAGEKPAKARRAKTGAQPRTGVVPKRAAEDDPRTWGDAESGNDHDAWLKEQKPPHWG